MIISISTVILSFTMTFNENLQKCIHERNSLVCVGLDVVPDRFPSKIRNEKDPVFAFNRAIIDATSDFVAAYKPNLAFYEALGTYGLEALQKTVEYIPDGILKIGDAKRGDIGSTAEKYAQALFSVGFDAVTVNPYLGLDSVSPFIKDAEKGVFILCLTSNPSSKDFQYITYREQELYKIVAKKAVEWNQNGNIGLVVGATHPDELAAVRAAAEDLPFLIPGIGAQGGDLEGSVKAGAGKSGDLAVINSSRGIIYASKDDDFAEAAGNAAKKLRDSINRVRGL